jgi:transposase-like protein
VRERRSDGRGGVRANYASKWPLIGAVAGKVGMGSAETLRKWIRQAEVDGGTCPAELRRHGMIIPAGRTARSWEPFPAGNQHAD